MDPYDYKRPQRSDTMTLSTIKNEDAKVQNFKGGLNTGRDYSYNLFNMDIVGK